MCSIFLHLNMGWAKHWNKNKIHFPFSKLFWNISVLLLSVRLWNYLYIPCKPRLWRGWGRSLNEYFNFLMDWSIGTKLIWKYSFVPLSLFCDICISIATTQMKLACVSFSFIFFLYIEGTFLKYNSFFPTIYILHPITLNMIQEGENTSSNSVQLDYYSLKVLFQGRGFNTKIITGVITIKACNGEGLWMNILTFWWIDL